MPCPLVVGEVCLWGVGLVFLLTTVGYRWYLQSYETEKMEGIFESISIEWARKGVWIIGPTNLDLMTTPSGPCDIAGNPGNSRLAHES